MEDAEIKKRAEKFARAQKKVIAKNLTDTSTYPPNSAPFSLFMAGSPGAGKTELSKRLIKNYKGNTGHEIVRIDGDDLRSYLPGYTGTNSSLFQGAISILVDKIQDMALDNGQTFLLDGTLSRYDKAEHNIRRSIEKNRPVFIVYVYQTPEVAWAFTKAREVIEGRNISKEVFIQKFLEARTVIQRIRDDFGGEVVIFLVKRNFETHAVEDVLDILPHSKGIDEYLEMRYTRDDLEKLL
jgi:UDP-N-acetylglucosamine kinase